MTAKDTDNKERSAPTMSRRQFEYLADWLHIAIRGGYRETELAMNLADWLARTNPRFDHSRFLDRVDPDQLRIPPPWRTEPNEPTKKDDEQC